MSENITNIEHSIRLFIDRYCNTDHIKNLMSKNPPEIRAMETIKIASYIMNFCETLHTGIFYPIIDEDILIAPKRRNSIPLIYTLRDENEFNLANSFNKNINFWLKWTKSRDSICNIECSSMMNYFMDIMSKNRNKAKVLIHTDDNFDIDYLDIDPKRDFYSGCGLKGYFGPKSKSQNENVSQIRTKTCEKITEPGKLTDVIVLMYKVLFDYCVQRFIFKTGILDNKPSYEKLKTNITRDISRPVHIKDQKKILETCMIRIKMVIYLRIFHGICCSGKNINRSHWDFVMELSRFRNVLSDVYNDILEDEQDLSDEDDQITMSF